MEKTILLTPAANLSETNCRDIIESRFRTAIHQGRLHLCCALTRSGQPRAVVRATHTVLERCTYQTFLVSRVAAQIRA